MSHLDFIRGYIRDAIKRNDGETIAAMLREMSTGIQLESTVTTRLTDRIVEQLEDLAVDVTIDMDGTERPDRVLCEPEDLPGSDR